MKDNKPQTSNRFEYISKEEIKDTMLWFGSTEEEINSSSILDKFPIVYDKLNKEYISVQEYEKMINGLRR